MINRKNGLSDSENHNIKRFKKFSNQENRQNNKDFKKFVRDCNNGVIDLSEENPVTYCHPALVAQFVYCELKRNR